jgi:predicted amidohydrolase
MVMESEELLELMKQIEEKGIGWDKVEEQTKISYDLLKLYVNSGPVPVTIINGLKKVLEEPPQ